MENKKETAIQNEQQPQIKITCNNSSIEINGYGIAIFSSELGKLRLLNQ